ncbi:hypothetical protein FOD82_09755 (plasmid) [Lactobacillus sp. LL6]|nr:hypothetical protein FOD82_09755 [Lactobacillus sp. LL6]
MQVWDYQPKNVTISNPNLWADSNSSNTISNLISQHSSSRLSLDFTFTAKSFRGTGFVKK